MGLFRKALLGTAVAVVASAGSAYAVPITGMISVTGTDTYDANKVTFVGKGSVDSATETGSFTVIGDVFKGVTLTGFTYAPALSPSPVTIYSVTNSSGTATSTFTLSSIINYTNSGNQLSINGVGTLTLTGFDATVGNFEFSTQGGSNMNVSFSATATAVPEPASLALFGAGMVGVGIFRRRRAK